ncbi:MAG: coiled-coil domain-containing protein [Cyanobium sp.]
MRPRFQLRPLVQLDPSALPRSRAIWRISGHLVVFAGALQVCFPLWAGPEATPGDPDVAHQAALLSLALPGCRAALGLPADSAAADLLRSDPTLEAKLSRTPACQSPSQALVRLEQLDRELAASRERMAAQQAELARETARQDALAAELAQIRRQLTAQPADLQARPGQSAAVPPTPTPTTAPQQSATLPAPAPDPVTFTPGKGVTLQAGGSRLQIWAEAKLLGFSSSRYVFNPGQPLVVSPKDPAASYDLSAQQSTVTAAFQGPKWGSWTPGAFALFTLQDNLLAEGYSFTPVAFYGEISDGRWRIAAGQNFDVFAPRDPDTLPSGKLAATGNPGAYRPQFRLERAFQAGPGFGGVVQVAASSPITTALPKEVDVANLQVAEVVEDNGWPNVEARISLGFGEPAERAGGRRLRPVELGASGVVGQLRVLDNIRPTDPLTLVSDRSIVSVWGAAIDGQIALGRRFGISGELYTGQGLGEYMAGIFQTYNRATNKPVPTSGGWGQLFFYPAENLRFNVGYGMDNATDAGLFGLEVNNTIFANAVWDVNAWLQLGLEGNYKLTTYDSFGEKEAWVVISEVLIRL